MTQEFNVLRCFSCNTFQVHIVKKAKKWECKICCAKQSLKRNYGKGSGKDCRLQVMKLNELQILNQNTLTQEQLHLIESETENDSQQMQNEFIEKKKRSSKWEQYIDESELEDNDDNDDDDNNQDAECFKEGNVDILSGNLFKKRKVTHEEAMCTKNCVSTVKIGSSYENLKSDLNISDKKNSVKNWKEVKCEAPKENDVCNFNLFDDSTGGNEKSKKRKFDEYNNENKIPQTNVIKSVNTSSNIFDSDPNDLDEIINMSF